MSRYMNEECMDRGMRTMNSYCNDVRPERTQFDKDLQNMWCPSCCGPTGPTGPNQSQNSARYTNSNGQDLDFRGNLKVSGIY